MAREQVVAGEEAVPDTRGQRFLHGDYCPVCGWELCWCRRLTPERITTYSRCLGCGWSQARFYFDRVTGKHVDL